jgi:hypothetical protein
MKSNLVKVCSILMFWRYILTFNEKTNLQALYPFNKLGETIIIIAIIDRPRIFAVFSK